MHYEHVDGGEYSKNGHIGQMWDLRCSPHRLVTYKFVALKNGQESKKFHRVLIPYTKVDECPCCKKITACNYRQSVHGFEWIMKVDKELFIKVDFGQVCKSCNMKFVVIGKQFDVLYECFNLLVQMRREIRYANSNRRAVKRVPMFTAIGN